MSATALRQTAIDDARTTRRTYTGFRESRAASRKLVWAGRIATGLPVLFLLFDSAIKVVGAPQVAEGLARLGYPAHLALTIGVLELICLAVYLIPRTSIVGAVLLTGFLGGATATHVRIGDPLFSHMLFPGYVAVLLWLGLYLRDARLRALITGAHDHN